MSEEWRKPPSELNFRDGCFRGACSREACFRDPCAPPEEESEGDGKVEGDCIFIAFNGASSYINGGSDASLDDLHAGDFSVDLWIKIYDDASGFVIDKYQDARGLTGWSIDQQDAPGINLLLFEAAYTNDNAYSLTVEGLPDNTWGHAAVVFQASTDKKAYIAIDGVWCTYVDQTAASGNAISDADKLLLIGCGRNSIGLLLYYLHADYSWLRLSSGARFTPGVNFEPPDRCTAPAVDGTTVELWAMDEGVGAVTAASVNSPANDGAMTDCIWGNG